MTELEKAAESKEQGWISVCGYTLKKGDVRSIFQAGAEWQQSEQSPWIRTEDRLPEDKEPVLTSSSIYGTKLLAWSDHYKVWEDEEGDCYCPQERIDAWMPIPE